MNITKARKLAYRMAREAGLPDYVADAVMHRYAAIHDPEFTEREVRDFIQQEIQMHAQP